MDTDSHVLPTMQREAADELERRAGKNSDRHIMGYTLTVRRVPEAPFEPGIPELFARISLCVN